MAYYLAVSNRKGGVGKSTVSIMLAHSLAAWGGQRVLVIDIDSQCNASLILLGGRAWNEARKARRNIADFFVDLFRERNAPPSAYLVGEAGDVLDDRGSTPALSLLPGSLLLDDVQGELFMDQSDDRRALEAFVGLRGKFESMLKSFDGDFDTVILDCAPGLSFATLAAIAIADKVIVPFRPDYVSLLAIDRIAFIIENVRDLDALARIPVQKRRYACLANYVRGTGAERLLIEEISLSHPLLATQMPQRDDIAAAFDWMGQRRTITEKYGDAIGDLRTLYDEVSK